MTHLGTHLFGLELAACRSLDELVQAPILGPSDDGDDFVRLKYMKYSQNWRDYENPSAPLSVL